ncbi:GDP-fucose synthetase [bacterium]|nr:GDP-fucose synthetase [bacterium]
MSVHKEDIVLITGGQGFLGKSVCNKLNERGYKNLVALPGSKFWNLTQQSDVASMMEKFNPRIVIHLAARVGGIGANKENPGKFIYENLAMGINLIEESRKREIKKFVMVGTVCAYPKFTPVPFKEEDIWKGYPEETNAPYGIAKKTLMQMIASYNEQYGLNGVNLIPVNMYGPHDNFDPQSSHVIPALILKFHQAMEDIPHKPVTIWGTGTASREFLYVDDCAEAIVLAMEQHNDPQPVNIGTGQEITIKKLATLIAQKMGYQGDMVFDSSKPDGQPRRCLDTQRADAGFGFIAQTDFDKGMEQTIEWFKGAYE